MEVDSNKKSSKGYIIALITAVIVILGLVGYIFYEKGFLFSHTDNREINMTNKREKNKEIDDTEELEKNDSRFINLYNDLKDYSYGATRKDSTDYSSIEYAFLVGKNIKEADITKTSETWEYGTYYVIEGSKIENILREYFGSSFTFDRNKIVSTSTSVDFDPNGEGSGMTFVSYDSANDNYKLTFAGIGGTSGPSATIMNQEIVAASRKNEEITVISKAIYINTQNDANSIKYDIYSDKDQTNLIESFTYSYEEVSSKSISVENYLEKASTITYQFKLDQNTNKYYFVSSRIN